MPFYLKQISRLISIESSFFRLRNHKTSRHKTHAMQALPEHPQQTPRIRTRPILPETGSLFKPSPPSARSLAAALLLLAFQTFGLPLQAQPPASPLPASPLPVTRGLNGWLFLASELRFLKAPTFWGAAAKSVSRSPNPDHADPLTAIEDFHKQLSALGIHLLLVPVPAKARVYSNQLAPHDSSLPTPDPFDSFFQQLDSRRISFVDLRPVLARTANPKQATYCKTDSHWSGTGCVLAAQEIAKKLQQSHPAIFPKASDNRFEEKWDQIEITGDLSSLAPNLKVPKETVAVRRISQSNSAIQPDPSSPLLLMGDSHTLVFHDFMAEHSGLLDQLAKETSVVPDLIGTRGSGSNAVRVSLLRRSIKDPKYLASKKVVLWCFAAREFTESDQGWQPLPIQR